MKKYKATLPKTIKIVDTEDEFEFRTGKYIRLGADEFFDTFEEARDWLLARAVEFYNRLCAERELKFRDMVDIDNLREHLLKG